MALKIVTDSTADLPANIVKELDITVAPEYPRFGEQVYRDGVDITEDEFYKRLLTEPVLPKTAQPTPRDFAAFYNKLSQETDSILSIHLSGKLSGTYESAVQATKLLDRPCNIEVVDSQMVSVALGLVVMQAAKMARSGLGLKQIVGELGQIISNVHMLILFDTLKYLSKGGRIGKGKALLGSLLNVKPLLMLKDGELVPSGQVRARSKGMTLLTSYVANAKEIQDMAVLYSTTPDDAQALIDSTSSIFPKERTILARLGPALGVHGGPGVLAVAIREKGTAS